MKTRRLGRTGIEISEVGLGTWAFASHIYGKVEASDAHETIRTALDRGISVFDTAPLYGNDNQNGISESILGAALGSDRNHVYISSKFGRYSTDGAAPNFHAQRARESVEGSLRRLNTDRIDILFFHSPFSEEDINQDVWEELDKLKSEGKIRFLGHSISMFEQTKGLAERWAQEGLVDVVQLVYSLMNREATALIARLHALDVAVFARESLANGFLSGRINADTVFPSGTLNARYPREEIIARAAYADELKFLVRNDVQTLPEAATRWVLDNPGVSLVLSGAKTTVELKDWIRGSAAEPFSPDEMKLARELHVRDYSAA